MHKMSKTLRDLQSFLAEMAEAVQTSTNYSALNGVGLFGKLIEGSHF